MPTVLSTYPGAQAEAREFNGLHNGLLEAQENTACGECRVQHDRIRCSDHHFVRVVAYVAKLPDPSNA